MEVRRQDDTLNRPEGERTIDAPYVTIDLQRYIEQIKNEEMWQKRDHNAITVFKDDQLTVVLVAMHPNAEIRTLRPKHLWTGQVLSGRVQVLINDKEITLESGQIIALHAGIPYCLQAKEESLLLLNVAGEEPESGAVL
jgi:quercetin dioxygenase-like cupin family protein